MGQALKIQSDLQMEASWFLDLQSKECYIYDYFHDSEPDLCKGLSPASDSLKTKIDAKYIVTQYPTLSKDQVEYHLMFKPSQENPLSYYESSLGKYGSEFPIGLYVDVPDNKGVYRKWLICARDYEQQFVKYSILPCNYYFKWIYEYQKYEMWGVARIQSSYNSGIWQDFKITSMENQNKIWLPMNNISENLYYNQRIIISAPIPKPITWEITKVENTHPFGINKLSVAQTKFNPNTDYVNLETGEMYADYYKNNIPLDEDDTVLTINSKEKTIKVGGSSRKITSSTENPSWSFLIDGVDATSLLDIYSEDNNISITFLGDETYIGKILTVICNQTTLSLEIVSL